MKTREIVILANSRKHDGHCIAGKDIATGEWIRPIKGIGSGQVFTAHPTFQDEDFQSLGLDASGPQLLDCIRMGFGNDCPLPYQPENKFIDGKTWEKTGKFSPHRIPELIDRTEPAFFREFIPAKELVATPPTASLNFLRLTSRSNNVEIIHLTKHRKYPQHRLKFYHGSKRYDLAITDFHYENLVAQSLNDDSRIIEDFYLTIGLGENFTPSGTTLVWHYHFIVGIIPSYQL